MRGLTDVPKRVMVGEEQNQMGGGSKGGGVSPLIANGSMSCAARGVVKRGEKRGAVGGVEKEGGISDLEGESTKICSLTTASGKPTWESHKGGGLKRWRDPRAEGELPIAFAGVADLAREEKLKILGLEEGLGHPAYLASTQH